MNDNELEKLALDYYSGSNQAEPMATTISKNAFIAGYKTHQSETDLLRKRIEKLRSVVEIVKEKTYTDPAEGPELRARAEFIYSLVHHALKADDKESEGDK
jgi:hypothetical protein